MILPISFFTRINLRTQDSGIGESLRKCNPSTIRESYYTPRTQNPVSTLEHSRASIFDYVYFNTLPHHLGSVRLLDKDV